LHALDTTLDTDHINVPNMQVFIYTLRLDSLIEILSNDRMAHPQQFTTVNYMQHMKAGEIVGLWNGFPAEFDPPTRALTDLLLEHLSAPHFLGELSCERFGN